MVWHPFICFRHITKVFKIWSQTGSQSIEFFTLVSSNEFPSEQSHRGFTNVHKIRGKIIYYLKIKVPAQHFVLTTMLFCTEILF